MKRCVAIRLGGRVKREEGERREERRGGDGAPGSAPGIARGRVALGKGFDLRPGEMEDVNRSTPTDAARSTAHLPANRRPLGLSAVLRIPPSCCLESMRASSDA